MRVSAAILAGGLSTRLGIDKTTAPLGSRPVWRWPYDTFSEHPEVDRVIVVGSEANRSAFPPEVEFHLGGATRVESAMHALKACCEEEILLLHDAGRPFIDRQIISLVLNAIRTHGAAAPAVPVRDTIRSLETRGTLDRSKLVAMQTPQGALTKYFQAAFASPNLEATDDLSLLTAAGIDFALVEGREINFKITTSSDLERARILVGGNLPRVGSGYDVHTFSSDSSRTLMLGGVAFPGHRALDGHSDADALLHAITDAVLGSLALGDIGQHFENTDEQWKNASSTNFLRAACKMIAERGYRVVNVDATVIAETPKVMPRSMEMRATIAESVYVAFEDVSIKATTNERMGFVGREEGIAAFATVLVAPLIYSRFPQNATTHT